MADQKPEEHLSEHEILDIIVERAKGLARQYGLHVLLGVGVVFLGLTIHRIYSARQLERKATARRAVSEMLDVSYLTLHSEPIEQRRLKDIQRARDLAENGPRTDASPWITLKLGNLHAYAEEWQQAADAYGSVLQRYPDSAAAEVARTARAAALEALGRYGEAATLYGEAARTGLALHYLDSGRCHELAADAAAARGAYRALADNTDTPPELRKLAQSRLDDVSAGRLLDPPPALEPLRKPAPSAPTLSALPQETVGDADETEAEPVEQPAGGPANEED